MLFVNHDSVIIEVSQKLSPLVSPESACGGIEFDEKCRPHVVSTVH